MIQILSLTVCGTFHYASGFVAVSSSIPLFTNGGRNNKAPNNSNHHNGRNFFPSTTLSSSPLDDFLGNIFGKEKDDNKKNDNGKNKASSESNTNEGEMSLSSFQQELVKRQEEADSTSAETIIDDETNKGEGDDEESEFDGYDLRDVIFYKWGECYDVEFQRVDSYGVQSVYMNIMPFRLGKRPFRHETEMDYLCHLQAVVDILVKYNQLDYALAQLFETDKKPRAGTSPLIAVPLRLDLTPAQVQKILG